MWRDFKQWSEIQSEPQMEMHGVMVAIKWAMNTNTMHAHTLLYNLKLYNYYYLIFLNDHKLRELINTS